MATNRTRANVASDKDLERHRDNNLRRLLVAATRSVNRHITAELQRRGYERTRPGHAALLANLDFDGNSVTEVADRAQISKQAIAKLAVELEEMGIISRRPSRTDGRALVLCFTVTGKRLVRTSLTIVDELEQDLKESVGSRTLATLKNGLAAITRLA